MPPLSLPFGQIIMTPPHHLIESANKQIANGYYMYYVINLSIVYY